MPFLTIQTISTINAGGQTQQLYYELIGELSDGQAEKPYLVFLHEGLGCTAMWKDFPQRLCAITGCPGLLYDRLGYGNSDALQYKRDLNYLQRYALDELPQVLAQLIPQRPYIVIGHSDGGSIALLHAAQQPDLLHGIVTEAAHVFVEDITLAGIRVADAAYAAGKLRGLSKYHGDKTEQIFKAWSETWLMPAFADWNMEAALPSITCPALILQGAGDQYGSRRQVDAIVAGIAGIAGPARMQLIDDCGHSPHQEQTEVVLQLMQDFITSLPPA